MAFGGHSLPDGQTKLVGTYWSLGGGGGGGVTRKRMEWGGERRGVLAG